MKIIPYVQIARPDHWFKNLFLLPGICLALFFDPRLVTAAIIPDLVMGFVAACLVASSNYVLNEILDAEKDRAHPEKQRRPLACGEAKKSIAYVEWLILGALGIALAFRVNAPVGWAGVALWVAGVLYNVPPVRFKEWPYLDVLSESINNPIRLALGWHATGLATPPPLSMVVAYWMFGCFLMGTKRLAEYRHIGDSTRAAAYRRSFAFYTDERLIESLMFYAALFALMSGVFIARYRVELVLATPLLASCMAYYVHLGFKDDSPAQRPERLLFQPKLMVLVTLTFVASAALLFVQIPSFNAFIEPWITPLQRWH